MVIDTILFARLPQWGSIDKKILHCSALRERPSPRVRRSAFDSPRSHFPKAVSNGDIGNGISRMDREKPAGEVNYGSRAVTSDEASRREIDL